MIKTVDMCYRGKYK